MLLPLGSCALAGKQSFGVRGIFDGAKKVTNFSWHQHDVIDPTIGEIRAILAMFHYLKFRKNCPGYRVYLNLQGGY